MIKLLVLEDRQPLNDRDRETLECIAAAVAKERTASLDTAVKYLQECFPSYKSGRGGSHAWISRRVAEGEGQQFPEGWHRIGMIAEREYLTADELTATMVRRAGGNEVPVVARGEVCTVRKVGHWYLVRNTVTGVALKWAEWDLVRAFLVDGIKAGTFEEVQP